MKNSRSFILLLVSQSIANAGDIFYLVSIISLTYSISTSIFLVSLIPFINTFSRFIGGLIAPYLLDKFMLKRILVVTSFLKGLFLFTLTLFYYGEGNSFFFFYTLTFVSLIAFLDSWTTPARNAMLPSIAGKNKLVRANSLMAMSDQTIQLAGWPLGTILVVILNEQLLLMITSFIFILGGLMTVFINQVVTVDKKESSRRSNISVFKEGWVYIWNHKSLKTIFIVDSITSLTGAIWIAAILYVYVEDVLQKSEVWWGYINSTFFAGLLLGGIVCLKLERKFSSHVANILIRSSFAVALLTLAFGFPQTGIIALCISFLIGIPTQIQEITQLTVIQKVTDRAKLPKVFSARDVILTSFFGISSLLVGGLAELIGVQFVFVLASLLLSISGFIYLVKRDSFPSNTIDSAATKVSE